MGKVFYVEKGMNAYPSGAGLNVLKSIFSKERSVIKFDELTDNVLTFNSEFISHSLAKYSFSDKNNNEVISALKKISINKFLIQEDISLLDKDSIVMKLPVVEGVETTETESGFIIKFNNNVDVEFYNNNDYNIYYRIICNNKKTEGMYIASQGFGVNIESILFSDSVILTSAGGDKSHGLSNGFVFFAKDSQHMITATSSFSSSLTALSDIFVAYDLLLNKKKLNGIDLCAYAKTPQGAMSVSSIFIDGYEFDTIKQTTESIRLTTDKTEKIDDFIFWSSGSSNGNRIVIKDYD